MRGYLLVAVLAPAAGAGEVRFTSRPRARKVRGKAEISFAVSAPTDVEVAVLDPGGKVVRHLAAGVLGKNAPAPLRKNSLVQSLEWDMKDDAGRPAAGGPFKVRVGLGLGLKPDRVFAERLPGTVRAIAVRPGGELYVLNYRSNLHKHDGSPMCHVLDREGRYVRTVMPWPGELPPERREGFGFAEVEGQGRIPLIYHGENRSFYPFLREPARCFPAVSSGGRLIFADSNTDRGGHRGAGPMRLMRVEKDGGCPREGFLGPTLAKSGSGFPQLALSPDEKTLYVTGLVSGGGRKARPLHAVYKLPVGAKKDVKPKVFVGDPRNSGSDDRHLNDPRGVAVDGEGNVHVSDRGNDRIIAFRPNGKVLGQLKVEAPDGLAVHRRTGAIYVLAGKYASRLVKLSGVKDGRTVASVEFKAGVATVKHAHRRPVLALDWEAEPPVVWVASLGGYSGYQLKRLEDAGSSFKGAREVLPRGAFYFIAMSLDSERDELYLRNGGYTFKTFTVMDGKTGRRTSRSVPYPPRSWHCGGTVVYGEDGYLYEQVPGAPAGKDKPYQYKGLYRFSRDMKPAPFESGKPMIPIAEGSLHLLARGLDVNVRGEGVVQAETRSIARRQINHVMSFGPEGRFKNKRLISGLTAGACSIRIDNAGDIYIADSSKPEGQIVPPELKGVPTGRRLANGQRNWYPVMCAGIIKFPPTGGKLEKAGEGMKVTVGYRETRTLSGALWLRGGVSQVPLPGQIGGLYYCSCEQLRFDIDGFGRVFAPDLVRFQMAVMDTAGNPIGRFGSYGNVESQLRGGAALRFAWPQYVAAGGGVVYVGDMLNQSVLRALVTYAVEETCAVE